MKYTRQPQRHRGTEKTRRGSLFSSSLLCASVPLWLPLFAFLAGCSRQVTTTTASSAKLADPIEEVTETAREMIRKSSDATASRRLVDQLNASLTRAGLTRKPEVMSDADKQVLKSEYLLQDDEVAEVARQEFTPLDAHYLDET